MSIDVKPAYIFIHSIKYSWTNCPWWEPQIPLVLFLHPCNSPRQHCSTPKETFCGPLIAKSTGWFSTVFWTSSNFIPSYLLKLSTIFHLIQSQLTDSSYVSDFPLAWRASLSLPDKITAPWICVSPLLTTHKFILSLTCSWLPNLFKEPTLPHCFQPSTATSSFLMKKVLLSLSAIRETHLCGPFCSPFSATSPHGESGSMYVVGPFCHTALQVPENLHCL